MQIIRNIHIKKSISKMILIFNLTVFLFIYSQKLSAQTVNSVDNGTIYQDFKTEFMWDAKVKIANMIDLGESKRGVRRVIPIIGVTFSGPKIKGEVLSGGEDTQLVRPDGDTELNARYLLKTDETYLFVDVGGGSTEFTLFSNGKMINSRSFKAGTVRLLNEMVCDVVWEEIEKWIKQNTANYDEVTLIGSGGNINKLFKMSGKMQEKPLSYIYINSQYSYLNSLTYEQRISQLGLNPDRADVIVPATRIYLNAMKWSGARQIYVPKIGLSDGIVKAMYYGKI